MVPSQYAEDSRLWYSQAPHYKATSGDYSHNFGSGQKGKFQTSSYGWGGKYSQGSGGAGRGKANLGYWPSPTSQGGNAGFSAWW